MIFRQYPSTFTNSKSLIGSLFCAALLAGAGRANAATFTINVAGSGCAAGAQVAAVVLNAQGPDPLKTVIATADGSGVATLTGLTTTDNYQFVAANPGCTPGFRDELQDPTNAPATITDGGNRTITLTSGATDSTLVFNVKIPSGVFPKLVTGGCNIASNNVQAGYALSSFVGQTGTLTFYNLRPAAGGTYNCNINSPADNRGTGVPVAGALTSGGTLNVPGTVDLTQSFAPPSSSENQNSRDGGNQGLPSLVVLLQNNALAPVGGAQMRLKNDPTGNPFQFIQTDLNGVGTFYGLGTNTTTTYYLDVIAPGLDGKVNIVFSTPSWTTTVSTAITLSPLTHPGTISGQILTNNAPFPGVWMNCHPDFKQYPGSDAFGGNQPHAGAGDVGGQLPLGSYSFTNLVQGNYDCFVNSPFSQSGTRFGDGPDGVNATADDVRLTIDALGIFHVYDSSGVQISSNVPYNVTVPVSPGAVGSITGTLTFPDAADLTSNPVTIMAYEQNGGGNGPPKGGIAVVNGDGATETYTIQVPTGTVYGLQVQGITYGAVKVGQDQLADLTNTDSASNLNFTMAAAGSIHAVVIGPDGSRFLPATQAPPGAPFNWYQTSSCSLYINANGQNVQAYGNGNADATGNVNIAGLPTGTYNLRVQTQGGGCHVTNATVPNITVSQGRTTEATINLQNGVPVEVTTGALPPGINIQTGNGGGNNNANIVNGLVVAYPRGTPLNLAALQNIGNGTIDPNMVANLAYSSFTNINNVSHFGWIVGQQGNNQQSAPKVIPGQFTFYLFAAGDGNIQYDTILGQSNVVVDAAHATALSTVFASSVVPVGITSTFGSATVTGLVNGSHLMTRDDFVAAGGDSNKIFGHIPVCAAYDNNSNLLGFATAIPPAITQQQETAIDTTFATNDADAFLALIHSFQFGYTMSFLPAGTFTLACTTPNYPPVVNTITLTAGQTTTQNINFDDAAAGGTISGKVTDASHTPLAGASVTVRTKTLTKSQTTDASGNYAFPNLADGIYRMETNNPGYASATDKSIISNGAPVTINFALTTAPGSITGTVYASVFPNRVTAGGAHVYAYDDTTNTQRLGPDAPHWVTTTDANGVYILPNPAPGDIIKIFATTDGKFPSGTQATATTGSVNAPDIILAAIPPTPSLQYKPRNGTSVDLTVHIPKVLAFAPTLSCVSGTTYTSLGALDVSGSLVAAPDNVYVATNVTMPAAICVCRLTTDDGIKQQNTDTTINLGTTKEQSNNAIRDEAFGGSIESDSDSHGASIDFPMGSIVTDSGTLPIVDMTRNTDVPGSIPVTGQDSVISDSFQLQSDANLQLGNGKSLDVTLPVSGNEIPDPHTLRLGQIINGVVVPVDTQGFYDPLTGRYTVSINSLGNAPAASLIRFASATPGLKGLAPLDGRRYSFSKRAAAVQSGSFVLIAVPAGSTTSAPFGGTAFGAYNFPNPFNLKSKTLTLSGGGSIQTDGTVLRYNLPPGNAGHVVIRIFSVAGELVRSLDEGDRPGGNTYYVPWDGKNMKGSQVASGVYFAVFDVPGLKAKQHVVKLAVLK